MGPKLATSAASKIPRINDAGFSLKNVTKTTGSEVPLFFCDIVLLYFVNGERSSTCSSLDCLVILTSYLPTFHYYKRVISHLFFRHMYIIVYWTTQYSVHFICSYRDSIACVFGSFDPIHKDDLKPKIFWSKICRDRCNFMSIEEKYGKDLLAYSPYVLKYFARILRLCSKLLASSETS